MDFLSVIILGVLQGVTEFLPVSSSGHLVIGNYLLGIEKSNDILFEVILHLGTLVAITYYYKKDIKKLSKGVLSFNKESLKYLYLIILATIPAVFVGLVFNNQIKNLYNIQSVSIFLLITGVIIFISHFSKEKSINLNPMDVLIIGIAQAFAILPGISRSGMTITCALLLGINREEGSKFSFIIAIPIIIGAVLLEVVNINQIGEVNFTNLVVGFITSSIVGYFSISWLIKIINKLHFWKFSFYCWLLGSTLLLINYYGRS